MGLVLAIGALVLCALPDLRAVADVGPSALVAVASKAAPLAEGTFLFYGPFSRLAWLPALLAALFSIALLMIASSRKHRR